MRQATGSPGRWMTVATTRSPSPTINAENMKFVQQLHKVGANVTVDLYGPGTHNWVYWGRELHRAWPVLTDKLAST